MGGWGIIGAGLVSSDPTWVVLGSVVIVAACSFGLLIKVNPKGQLRTRLPRNEGPGKKGADF